MSGKLKRVAKKAAKKTAKVAVNRLPAKPVAIARKILGTPGKKEGTMGDEMEELQKENAKLRRRVDEMEAYQKEAEAEVAQKRPDAKKWIRGKLPGDKLIKTDPDTGEWTQIDRAEWELLA